MPCNKCPVGTLCAVGITSTLLTCNTSKKGWKGKRVCLNIQVLLSFLCQRSVFRRLVINTQWVHCEWVLLAHNLPTICTTMYLHSAPKTMSPVINTHTMCQRNPCVTSHRDTKDQAKHKYKHSTWFDSFQLLLRCQTWQKKRRRSRKKISWK